MVRPTRPAVAARDVRRHARRLRRERHRHEDALCVLRWLRQRLRDDPDALTPAALAAWIDAGEREALIEVRKLRHQAVILLGDAAALSACDDDQRAVLED